MTDKQMEESGFPRLTYNDQIIDLELEHELFGKVTEGERKVVIKPLSFILSQL